MELLFQRIGSSYFGIQSVEQNVAYRNLVLNPVAGNVGIGTPSPAYKLDVNGNAMVRGPLVMGLGQPIGIDVWTPLIGIPSLTIAKYVTYPGYGGYATILKPTMLGFGVMAADSTALTMYLTGITGNLWIQGSYSSGSDDRIKFNKQKLEYGLAQVMALEPKRYDRAEYEYDPETEELVVHPEKISRTNEIGLVAQDVQRVIPEAVTVPENENNQLWSLSYDTIIPVLVKAIQEQQAQIEELKQEIQAMKPGI